MIQSFIDGTNGPNNDQPLPEKNLRQLIRTIDQKFGQSKQDSEKLVIIKSIWTSLNEIENVCTNTISGLKFLIVFQKLQLYCSSIICADKESINGLNIHKNMATAWREILSNSTTEAEDKYRCAFFTKLLSHLSSYFINKIAISYEFNHYIDTGFNL